MTIVVESGAGDNPAANSYVTVAELDSFAALRGVTLPTLEADKEVLLIQGTDYTEGFWNRFQGDTVSQDQPLQFPRSGVSVNGFSVDSDAIPQSLKNAQMQAAIESNSEELNPNTGQNVKMEKVDVIEVEYQDGNGSLYAPTFPRVDAYLDKLLKNGGNFLLVNPIR